MKNRVTIHMGASRHDVTVRGEDGQPVTFDLYHMTRKERSTFHREFMNAFRQSRNA